MNSFRKKMHALTLVATILVLIPASMPAFGAEHGTRDDAKRLAEKAATHMKDVGPEKAIADFSDKTAGYIDRDLWVIVFRDDAQIIANYGVPATIGKDASAIKDADGAFFGRAILAQSKSGMPGWVNYRLINPATNAVQNKSSYVVPQGNYVLFVGAYEY